MIVAPCYRDASVDRALVIVLIGHEELRTPVAIDQKHVYVCSGIRILAPEA
jgi:hypothetical protein